MKLINKFLIGFLALGLVTLVSCNKGDDDGPSEPAFTGNFTGNLTVIPSGGTTTEWVSSSITATHDTSFFPAGPRVNITVNDGNGNTIVVQLADTAATPQPYSFFQFTTSESTINTPDLESPASTRTNDTDLSPNGAIVITDNGEDDGILRGTINFLRWYVVGDEVNDDAQYAIFSEGSFEVPLTRTGTPVGGGDDSDISATIDGQAFTADIVSTAGLQITGASLGGSALSLIVPTSGVSLGDYSLDQSNGFTLIYTNQSQEAFIATSGTVSLSAYNAAAQTATGTFNATLTSTGSGTTVTATNGSFVIDN